MVLLGTSGCAHPIDPILQCRALSDVHAGQAQRRFPKAFTPVSLTNEISLAFRISEDRVTSAAWKALRETALSIGSGKGSAAYLAYPPTDGILW